MRQASNATLLLVLLLAGCASSADIEMPDVHGLAASPTDRDVAFVATHQGLARWEEGEGWSFVGRARDDYMGFTAHPSDPDVFWVSGHPRTGGNMGVRQSTDGGHTWTTRWDAPVDFHAMAVSPADPDLLWGYFRGQLHRSADGGATWAAVVEPAPAIRALAAHPTEREAVYAVTSSGLAVTRGGAWTSLAGLPVLGLAIDPTAPATMYAGGVGHLWKSEDGGAVWAPLGAPTEGAIAFLSVSRADPRVVYAATYEAGVYRSEDAGATWSVLRAPTR